jgi:hypothetical protein
MRELAIEIIRGGLLAKIDELGHRPRCAQCPLGTCSYCELRGCLALLKLFPPPKPRPAQVLNELKGGAPRFPTRKEAAT